jgi:hypothetical protein
VYLKSLALPFQSLACLALALNNELDNGTDDNQYAIAEVTRTVRAVQYLGVVIGVLSEFLYVKALYVIFFELISTRPSFLSSYF